METGEDSAAIQTTGKRIRKTDKNRRVWSKFEEECLMTAVKDIICGGWKCENGFRPGYLCQLEQHLKKLIPNTNLRGEPHINSRLHSWKKTHGCITSMLGRSGFGWNEEANMIVCDDDNVWNDYVRVDPFAKGLRRKSFPLFKSWCEVFGKDRATGAGAKDAYDFEQQINSTAETYFHTDPSPCGAFDFNVTNSTPDYDFETAPQANISSASKRTESAARKRKASAGPSDARFLDILSGFANQSRECFVEIARRIGYGHDASAKRQCVWDALGKLDHLSLKQRLSACKYLVKNSEDLYMFFIVSDEARNLMVDMIVTNKWLGEFIADEADNTGI